MQGIGRNVNVVTGNIVNKAEKFVVFAVFIPFNELLLGFGMVA